MKLLLLSVALITLLLPVHGNAAVSINHALSFTCAQHNAQIIVDFHANKIPVHLKITSPNSNIFYLSNYLNGVVNGVDGIRKSGLNKIIINTKTIKGKSLLSSNPMRIFTTMGYYKVEFIGNIYVEYGSPSILSCKIYYKS